MGKGATTFAPSGNIVKCFVHCNTLSRRIIYALFSQPVVGFWGLSPRLPPWLHPWTPLAGGPSSQTSNLPTPGKIPTGAHVFYLCNHVYNKNKEQF